MALFRLAALASAVYTAAARPPPELLNRQTPDPPVKGGCENCQPDGEYDDWTNHDEICFPHMKDTFANSAMSWQETRAGEWLDVQLERMAQDEKDGLYLWADRLHEEVFGADTKMDCADISGTCVSEESCTAWFERNNAAGHYVFDAVMGCQSAFKKIDEELDDNTLFNLLQIDEIVTDFEDVEKDTTDVYAALSAAFTIAAGIFSAFSPLAPIAAAFTVGAGAMSAASLAQPESEPPDVAVGLKKALGDTYDATRSALQDTLRTAFVGNRTISSEAIANLPGQDTNLLGVPYKSPIAAFFARGKFLYDSVDAAFKSFVEEGQQNTKHYLVNRALTSSRNAVLIDTSKTQESCTELGMVWQNDHCFYMHSWAEDVPDPLNGYTGPRKSDDARFNLMIDKYGMDLGEFYLNACQCRRHVDMTGEMPSLEIGAAPSDGSLPTCFFNMKCGAGTITTESHPIVQGLTFGKIEEVPITDVMIRYAKRNTQAAAIVT